jgi:inosine-uridine nucleoside N-ribohydrolase
MHKRPVIIDCDPGIDDIISFTFAFKSAKLEIKGITTVAGNQKIEITTQNALNALELMKRPDIPLSVGADKPLTRELRDAGHIHGENGLGGYQFQEKSRQKPVDKPAWDFMYEIIKASEIPITIIAIAPLTNIARLFQKYPESVKMIKEIVFMGGSIRTGNPTPVATFNVLCDPEAAQYVIRTKVPFVMCSLDCTRKAYITSEELKNIGAIHNPVAEMITAVTEFYYQTSGFQNKMAMNYKGVSVHDLCTIMYVTNPELFTGNHYFADVETKGELTTGFTLVDYEDNLKKPESEKTVFFLSDLDRQKFIEFFVNAIKRY